MNNPCITVGDPAGIGPECVIRVLARPDFEARVTLVCPRTLLDSVCEALCTADRALATLVSDFRAGEGTVYDLVQVDSAPPVLEPGRFNHQNTDLVRNCLETAVALALDRGAPLVTGPLDKRYFSAMGYPHSGHTEYLAQVLGVHDPVMLFQGAGPLLSTVVLTRHIALDEVTSRVKPDTLGNAVRLVHSYNRMMESQDQRHSLPMAVAGIDPHCGEWGTFSHTDLAVRQWVELLCEEGYSIQGPLPADTLFSPPRVKDFSTILCWYHDQGMVPVKAYAFDQAVNVTLGLPLVRTSPAHGVAYDLAWKGKASVNSMREAVKLAVKLSC